MALFWRLLSVDAFYIYLPKLNARNLACRFRVRSSRVADFGAVRIRTPAAGRPNGPKIYQDCEVWLL